MRSLPQAYEHVGAAEGTTVRVELVGPAGGTWLVRRGSERWHLVPEDKEHPTAVVRLSVDTAWRLLSRTQDRGSAESDIVVEGDPALGGAATRAVAIMTTKL
jgi:hypothetical protein